MSGKSADQLLRVAPERSSDHPGADQGICVRVISRMANTSHSRKGRGAKAVDPTALAVKFGKALRVARGSVTQVQLGQRTGIDQASLSLIERGLRLPTIEQVAKMEQALDLTRGALFEAGYAEGVSSTLRAIDNDAALHPVAREALRRVYAGLLEMPDE